MSCSIIAEAGVNHNGDLQLALQLVEAAARAGADAVKFQTFNPEALVSRDAGKADYQKRHTDARESQLDMLRRLQLSESDHQILIDTCQQQGIEFLSSPFDLESARLLTDNFGLQRIKLGSGELTNGPLLLALARSSARLILSTGMSTLDEVEQALSVLSWGYLHSTGHPSGSDLQQAYTLAREQKLLEQKITLLHCTTEYPAPFDEINLCAMDTLRETFGLPVGYSDHTPGIAISLAAAARGACVIEKHFTLDRALPGPDHQASIEPDELQNLVTGVRQIEMAQGDGIKQPTAAEQKNLRIARKSLVASRPIVRGEPYRPDNLTVKRPGDGVSPMRYWEFLGRQASRDYQEDELIEE